MIEHIQPKAFHALALVLLLAGTQGATQVPDQKLPAEIKRVAADVPRAPEDRRAALVTRVERATAAVEAGRFLQALFELEPAWEEVAVHRFGRDINNVKTSEAFTAKWKSMGEPRVHSGAAASPLALEALASAAEARGPVTYRAALPYSQDSGVDAGLYYLGESHAVVDFGRWVRSLTWPRAGTPPALRSLSPELDAFDAEITKAYERMTAAQHANYVYTSVALKRARALNDKGRFAGALLEYMLARYRYAPLREGPQPDAPTPARLAEARAALTPGVDHSIAQLFVEIAEAASTNATESVRRNAGAILDDILPAYRAAIASTTAPAAAAQAAPVTITLVRWPFT